LSVSRLNCIHPICVRAIISMDTGRRCRAADLGITEEHEGKPVETRGQMVTVRIVNDQVTQIRACTILCLFTLGKSDTDMEDEEDGDGGRATALTRGEGDDATD
jgi:hypothetical protein